MVRIEFLGGAREVGRSAILIESKSGSKCILDYGIRFNNEDRLPYATDLSNLKAIALSHCHIDHSGGLPFLYKEKTPPLITNQITLRISEILLKDMIKISNYHNSFGLRELEILRRNAHFLKNGVRQKIDDEFFISFFDAGHIPGSVSILVEVDDKKLLYTGDINTISTNLVRPANAKTIPKINSLITESTYALREHPPREELEEKFVEKIINIIDDGGNVLIPAFGVARSQEVLLILNKYGYTGDIYLDGLARKVSLTYMEFPKFIRNFNFFKKAVKKANFGNKKNRKSIINKSESVIISPSGMLKGGAAIDYIKELLPDSLSAVYLVGYQVEGSPGRKLIDEGIFEYQEKLNTIFPKNNLSIKARCDFDYFDFSSHADRSHLQEFINTLQFTGDSNFIFCVHGEEKATTSLAKIYSEKDFNSVAPEAGEIYKI